MKLNALAVTACLLVPSMSYARCWDECVPAPLGGCIGSYKMCDVDVDHPGRAAMSLGGDIKRAEDGIISTWHDAYGDNVPPVLQKVLADYPISIACAIFPETRGAALVVAALEGLVAHAKDRTKQAHDAESQPNVPDWKKQDIDRGNATVTYDETNDLAVTDFNAEETMELRDIYNQSFRKFVACEISATTISAGGDCFLQLEADLQADRVQALREKNARASVIHGNHVFN